MLRAHASLEAALALALTGLVLILIANFMPFMSFGMEGQSTRRASRPARCARGDGLWPLTLLILVLTIVAPALKLGAIDYVLAG